MIGDRRKEIGGRVQFQEGDEAGKEALTIPRQPVAFVIPLPDPLPPSSPSIGRGRGRSGLSCCTGGRRGPIPELYLRPYLGLKQG